MENTKLRLTRREILRLGLAGTALSWLGRGCQQTKAPSSSGTTTPTGPEPVYELTNGFTLYDDFDGHGNFQSSNNQNLAEAGRISSRIWNVWTGWGTADVVQNPVASGLLTVLNENDQRVEYRQEGKASRENKLVYAADGTLVEAVPHIPGEPYHGSRQLRWLGARDGDHETLEGPVRVQKGALYGLAEIVPAGGSGNAVRLAGSLRAGDVSIETFNPEALEPADNKSFSADVLLSSSSTSKRLSAVLDYHTTIPSQPPGKSWLAQIGIGTMSSDALWIIGQCVNVNTGCRYLKYLGSAQADVWYNLRMDMVTQKDDSTLDDKELRIDFYVNGALLASTIPEDSAVVLDPALTDAGPSRVLTVGTNQDGQSAVFYFDNVRAVYRNRIA